MPNSEQLPLDPSLCNSSETGHPLANRWQKLIEACLGGQLLPFLGAGISIRAALRPVRCPPRAGDTMPGTNVLTEKLLTSIQTHSSSSSWSQAEWNRIKDTLDKKGSNTFADATQLYLDLMAGAEQGDHPLYARGAPLDMRLFVRIRPNPAHRYLAWLVRESLFSEMISTNYDCALEDAYKESWGRALPGKKSSFHAISDHESYRRNAHERQRQHDRITVPILRLYKINGCASAYLREYKDSTKPAYNRGFIVITERHLQSFSKRQWARDMFRDRFRCRKLVFSGFGAEEPQIRFTALDVLEEFSKDTEGEPIKDCHCFLHVFDQALSASQLQIAKAAVCPPPSPDRAVFTGQDKTQFGLSSSSCGLTADAFWQCLYRQTTLLVIRRQFPFSVVATWLSEHDRNHRISQSVIHSFLEGLAIDTNLPNDFPDWMLPFFEFVSDLNPTLHLMDLAWRTRQISESDCSCNAGYYEEFNRPDSIPLKLLCLFHVLGANASDIRLGSSNIGFWIIIQVPPLSGTTSVSQDYHRWVLIVEEEPSRMPTTPGDPTSRQAICLTLKTPHTPGGTRSHKVSGQQATTWRVVSFEDLIKEASRLPLTQEIPKRFLQALISPKSSRHHESFYASHQLA